MMWCHCVELGANPRARSPIIFIIIMQRMRDPAQYKTPCSSKLEYWQLLTFSLAFANRAGYSSYYRTWRHHLQLVGVVPSWQCWFSSWSCLLVPKPIQVVIVFIYLGAKLRCRRKIVSGCSRNHPQINIVVIFFYFFTKKRRISL